MIDKIVALFLVANFCGTLTHLGKFVMYPSLSLRRDLKPWLKKHWVPYLICVEFKKRFWEAKKWRT